MLSRLNAKIKKYYYDYVLPTTPASTPPAVGPPARTHFALLLLEAVPYCLAHGLAHDVRFQKSSQYYSLQNADTSSVLEDPHGRFDLLLMGGTLL
jgi:hypothetical protein